MLKERQAMRITINGQPRETTRSTVAAILQEINLSPERVVVELNRSILPRDLFAETSLSEGDALEIVQFVGGG